MFRRERRSKQHRQAAPGRPLPPGTAAPDFRLSGTTDEVISLRDFAGRPVVLVFYPADWSAVCGDQLALYNEILALFEQHDAQLLAISVDGQWSHRAFARQNSLRFPLLADFHPKGAVAQAYGVYDEQAGVSRRALFVVDAEGIIQWTYVSPADINPGADGILSALENLTSS